MSKDGATPSERRTVTELLHLAADGDEGAQTELFEYLEPELRRRAKGLFARERRQHTLQPTVLIDEVFMRLLFEGRREWKSRDHFIGTACLEMRRLLIQHARAKAAAKRGGGVSDLPLDDVRGQPAADRDLDLLVAVDDALTELASLDPPLAKIVELYHFGGLTGAEIAEVVGRSKATVHRELDAAQRWLAVRLEDWRPPGPGQD